MATTAGENERSGSGGVQAVRGIDVLLPGIVEVHTGERTYRLRDDMGALVGLLIFRLQAVARDLPTFEQAAEIPASELEARVQLVAREQLAACGAIFRHTFPEMTDEEVGRALPTEQARNELVLAFFTRRFPPSPQPPRGLSDSTSGTEEPGQEPGAEDGADDANASSARTQPARPSTRGGTAKSKR